MGQRTEEAGKDEGGHFPSDFTSGFKGKYPRRKPEGGILKRSYMVTLIFSAIILINLRQAAAAPRIDVVGDSLYLDGKKFLVKGIGYSPFRPGVYPGARVSLDVVEMDFKRIKEAGFNTLRVWGTMPEEQLSLAEKYDLKVIQAAYVEPNAKFDYEGFQRQAESLVRQMVKISKNHSNVIMYLVTNEPHSRAILDSGIDKTLDLYKKLLAIIKQEDPSRPVSIANAYWTLWLDQSMWDVVCFNVYNYDPSLVADIGYANFIENLRALHAKEKPFLVTEFGLSVSPDGPGREGYGGNTQEEQAEGVVKNLQGIVRAGAIGGCVFEWNDEWWKGGNAAVHDAHPEEWFGIMGIESKENPAGTLRKAYYALKEEFKMIVTRPAEGHRMFNNADIEVNAPSDIRGICYKIDEGQWSALTKDAGWWRGIIAAESLTPGLHTLSIKGTNGSNAEIMRTVKIIKCVSKEDVSPAVTIEMAADKPGYQNGDVLKIKARLLDKAGNPLENYPVKMGVFNSASMYKRSWEGRTGEKGFFTGSIPVIGRQKEWYYVYWAGADSEDYSYKTKEGKLGYVKAVSGTGFPVKWLTAKRAEKVTSVGAVEDEWLKADKIDINVDTNFVEGAITDNDDLSAEVRALWDESNLYFRVDVKDNVPANNAYKKLDLWKGDSAELFISIDPAKIQEKGYTSSDFQILTGANGNMWVCNQAKGGVRGSVPVLSYAMVKKNAKGYTLEAKINIANFWDKPFRTFRRGDVLGFDIAIDDLDADGGTRKGKLIWNGTEEGYKDSAVWGRLKLE